MDVVWELMHVQVFVDHVSHSILPPDLEQDVIMLDREPIVTEPELTPISKSKKAQARFANALIDLCAPAFAKVTTTVLPYLDAVASSAAGSTWSLPQVFELPVPPQPCAQACIPLVQNPLARPLPPFTNLGGPSEPTAHVLSGFPKRRHRFMPAPDPTHTKRAYDDLHARLYPRRIEGQPFTPFICDRTTRTCLEHVLKLLSIYTHPDASIHTTWVNASLKVAKHKRKSPATAQRLRLWARQWITDRQVPANLYGTWSPSMLDDGDLSQKIHKHLQQVGKYRKAKDIIWYLDKPAVKEKFKLKKSISLATARRWMLAMKYRWRKSPKGESSFPVRT
jgi:hypothetical protein